MTTWNDYPLGTRAHDVTGGAWVRTAGGWTWPGGGTFPTPGGSAGRVEVGTQDERIRALLGVLDCGGQLPAVSDRLGPSVAELRRIAESNEDLLFMDRGVLALELLGEEVEA